MTVPFVRADAGGREVVNVVASSGTSHEIDLADGNYHAVTVDDDCTFSVTGTVADRVCSFTLELIQDGTGGRTVTWWGGIEWAGGEEPTLSTDADDVDILVFVTRDNGSTWRGGVFGLAFSSAGS